MSTSLASSHPNPEDLRSACDGLIACLNQLIRIHFTIDTVDRVIQPSAPDGVYRLRKALFHVRAITAWDITIEVMHIMAPEIRAALDQFDEVREETARVLDLGNIFEQRESKAARLWTKMDREFVSSYMHPSPQSLLLPLEEGGLVPGDSQRFYTKVAYSLFQLASGYAVSLGWLSHRLVAGQELAITEVVRRITIVIASVAPAGGGEQSAIGLRREPVAEGAGRAVLEGVGDVLQEDESEHDVCLYSAASIEPSNALAIAHNSAS